MNCNNILAFLIVGCLLVDVRVSAYFNQTNGAYNFMLSNVSTVNNQIRTSLTYAQEWCRSSGYTLATIPNKEVQGYIKQFISSATSSGLISNTDQIILNGRLYTSLTGTWNWVNGQPINEGVNILDQSDLSKRYYYGYLKTSDFQIHASPHNSGRFFICEYEGGVNDCAGGLSLNGRCYKIKTTGLTWYSARNECLDGNGDLASFETLNDSIFNSTLGSTLLANTSFWVGIQRVEWRWEDTGLAIKYTNWEAGSPSNNYECLSLRVTPGTSEWAWYNYECSYTFRFICLATSGTTVSTSSTIAKDTVSTKSGSDVPTPTFTVQPSSTTSMSSISNTKEGLGVGQGIGIGVGIGVGVMVIVLVVIFIIIRQQRNKRQTDAMREANGVNGSSIQQSSTCSTANLTSNNSNKISSKTNEMHLERTAANRPTSDPYETLQSADARPTESPYQQLDINNAIN